MANRADRMVDLFRVGFAAGNKVGGWIDESRGRNDIENLSKHDANKPTTQPEMFGIPDTSVPAAIPNQIQAPQQSATIPTEGMSPVQPESRMSQAASAPAQIQTPGPAPGGIPQQSPTTDAQMRQAQVDRPDTTLTARQMHSRGLAAWRDKRDELAAKVESRMDPKDAQEWNKGYVEGQEKQFVQNLNMAGNMIEAGGADPLALSKLLTETYDLLPNESNAIFTPNPEDPTEILGTFYNATTGKLLAPGVPVTSKFLHETASFFTDPSGQTKFREEVLKRQIDDVVGYEGKILSALGLASDKTLSQSNKAATSSNAKEVKATEKEYLAVQDKVTAAAKTRFATDPVAALKYSANGTEWAHYNYQYMRGNGAEAVNQAIQFNDKITDSVQTVLDSKGEIPQTVLDMYGGDSKAARVALEEDFNIFSGPTGSIGPAMRATALADLEKRGYIWRKPLYEKDGVTPKRYLVPAEIPEDMDQSGDWSNGMMYVDQERWDAIKGKKPQWEEIPDPKSNEFYYAPNGQAHDLSKSMKEKKLLQIPPAVLNQTEYKTAPGLTRSWMISQSGLGGNGYITQPSALDPARTQLLQSFFGADKKARSLMGIDAKEPGIQPTRGVQMGGIPGQGGGSVSMGGSSGGTQGNPLAPAAAPANQTGGRAPDVDHTKYIDELISIGQNKGGDAMERYAQQLEAEFGKDFVNRLLRGVDMKINPPNQYVTTDQNPTAIPMQ